MSQPHSLEVLVTGATGKQGGAVARALLSRGHRVRALTRSPSAPAAQALARLGASLVAGDFDDPTSLSRAARGVDSVFIMGVPWGKAALTDQTLADETRHGITLIDVAREVRAKHVVYTSIASADRSTGVSFYESKVPVERHLAAADVPYTILAPVFFMENINGLLMGPALKDGKYVLPLPPGRLLQQIAVADIGRFAAMVIEQPARFAAQRIELASDELSASEAVEILTHASGKTFTHVQPPIEAIRGSSAAFADMFEWFDRVGYGVDIERLRREYPEVGWHRYRDWALEQDWTSLIS